MPRRGRKHTGYSSRALGISRIDGQLAPSFILRYQRGRQSTIHRSPYSVYPRREPGMGIKVIMEAARDWAPIVPRIHKLLYSDGTLRECDMGGYPIVYLDRRNTYMCCECAAGYIHTRSDYQTTDYAVIWETDDDILCEDCGTCIAPADDEG